MDKDLEILKKALLNQIEKRFPRDVSKPKDCLNCNSFKELYHEAYNAGGFGDYEWKCKLNNKSFLEREWKGYSCTCVTYSKEEATKQLYLNCPYKTHNDLMQEEIEKAKKELFGE